MCSARAVSVLGWGRSRSRRRGGGRWRRRGRVVARWGAAVSPRLAAGNTHTASNQTSTATLAHIRHFVQSTIYSFSQLLQPHHSPYKTMKLLLTPDSTLIAFISTIPTHIDCKIRPKLSGYHKSPWSSQVSFVLSVLCLMFSLADICS